MLLPTIRGRPPANVEWFSGWIVGQLTLHVDRSTVENHMAALWDEQDPRQMAVAEGHSKGEVELEVN